MDEGEIGKVLHAFCHVQCHSNEHSVVRSLVAILECPEPVVERTIGEQLENKHDGVVLSHDANHAAGIGVRELCHNSTLLEEFGARDLASIFQELDRGISKK